MAFILLSQILRMRLMLARVPGIPPSNLGKMHEHTARKFAALRRICDGWANDPRCPGLVRRVYETVRDFLIRSTEPPRPPQEAEQAPPHEHHHE